MNSRAIREKGYGYLQWLWSVNGLSIWLSLLLNLALFGVMPGLIKHRLDHGIIKSVTPSIQVIPQTPHLPQPENKQKIIEKQKQIKLKPKTIRTAPSPIPRFNIPLGLNSTLPDTSQGHLFIPPLDLMEMNAPKLKTAYGMEDLDAPMTPLVKIPPVYPMRARRMGITGWVKVRFMVEKDGRLTHISIIKASPPDYFETSVLNCVSKWRFKPGTIEGATVRTWAETTIRFELEK